MNEQLFYDRKKECVENAFVRLNYKKNLPYLDDHLRIPIVVLKNTINYDDYSYPDYPINRY